MTRTQAQLRQRERGSALLLTLLLTVAGALILGLTVDATSLVWARANAQTTANLTAAAVALEMQRNPSRDESYLLETARAAAARNGFQHGTGQAAVTLEHEGATQQVAVERGADVFFLRIVHPEPVMVRAKAGL